MSFLWYFITIFISYNCIIVLLCNALKWYFLEFLWKLRQTTKLVGSTSLFRPWADVVGRQPRGSQFIQYRDIFKDDIFSANSCEVFGWLVWRCYENSFYERVSPILPVGHRMLLNKSCGLAYQTSPPSLHKSCMALNSFQWLLPERKGSHQSHQLVAKVGADTLCRLGRKLLLDQVCSTLVQVFTVLSTKTAAAAKCYLSSVSCRWLQNLQQLKQLLCCT